MTVRKALEKEKLMSWDYRVIRAAAAECEEGYDFAIYECYYDHNGKIWGLTEEPVNPYGESQEELTKDLQLMLEATTKPILNISELPEAGSIAPNIPDPKDCIPFEQIRAALDKEVSY